jgi:hypothetical protein
MINEQNTPPNKAVRHVVISYPYLPYLFSLFHSSIIDISSFFIPLQDNFVLPISHNRTARPPERRHCRIVKTARIYKNSGIRADIIYKTANTSEQKCFPILRTASLSLLIENPYEQHGF